MSRYQSFHEQVYSLPNNEMALFEIKTAVVALWGFIDLFDPKPIDNPLVGGLNHEEKVAQIPQEKEKVLSYIEKLEDQSGTLKQELGLLANAVFALVGEENLAEAHHITQVVISQIREKLQALT